MFFHYILSVSPLRIIIHDPSHKLKPSRLEIATNVATMGSPCFQKDFLRRLQTKRVEGTSFRFLLLSVTCVRSGRENFARKGGFPHCASHVVAITCSTDWSCN